MRQKTQQIDSRQVVDSIIRDSLVCRLALVDCERPYLIPVCFGYDGAALYVHTGMVGRKIDIIHRNPRVCFEFERGVRIKRSGRRACDWGLVYESVVGSGAIAELTRADAKLAGAGWIAAQYCGPDHDIDPEELQQTRIWRIAIDSITGRRSRTSGVEGAPAEPGAPAA